MISGCGAPGSGPAEGLGEERAWAPAVEGLGMERKKAARGEERGGEGRVGGRSKARWESDKDRRDREAQMGGG